MMTHEQAKLYRGWVHWYRLNHPELSDQAQMEVARKLALENREPPRSDYYRPPAKRWALPLWASAMLRMGGKAVLRALIGTRYRIAATAFFGAYVTACTVGALPSALCVHEAELGAILVQTGIVEPTPIGQPTPTPLPEE